MNFPATKRRQTSKYLLSKTLRLERLEDRHLLAGDEVFGTVTGRVWLDANADGVYDEGESSIYDAGVTSMQQRVRLQQVGPVGGPTVEIPFDGSFRFDNVPVGQYLLVIGGGLSWNTWMFTTELDSPSRINWEDDNYSSIETSLFTVEAGQDNSFNFDVGLIEPAEFTGFIWHDIDGDGIRSDDEPGATGALVQLLDADQNPVRGTRSRQFGRYGWPRLMPGQYTLELKLSDDVSLTQANQGGDDTTDSDFDPLTRQLPLSVARGQKITNIDAGLLNLSAVTGRVWEDLNGDGIQDEAEPGISSIVVYLVSDDNGARVATRADDNGEYRFEGVMPGNYGLQISLSGESVTALNQGADDSLDSDSLPGTGQIPTFTLAAGETNDTFGTGMIRPGTIAGGVWIDINRNGIRDTNESPATSAEVQLLDSQGTVISESRVSSIGEYAFQAMPGEYSVRLRLPEGVVLSESGVGENTALDTDFDPASSQTDTFLLLSNGLDRFDAGIIGIGDSRRIAGNVFDDVNGDGINGDGFDSAEPAINGVLVQLYRLGAGVVSTMSTGADGSYEFSDLPAGNYYVEFVAPTGTTLSPMNRGEEGQQDSSANRVTRRTPRFDLIPGQQLNSIDAGIYSGTFAGDVVRSLRITEIQFIGVEYIELKNIGDAPIDLNGVRFINGIAFDFTAADLSTLFPGELTVVVGYMDSFASWYDTETINVSGVYSGDLNQEERLELVAPINDTILDFRFDDDWFRITDDEDISFFPITVIDENAPADSWDGIENWRLSSLERGTPGVDDPRLTPDPGAIVINEILTNPTTGDDDWIELHNTTDRDIDVGNWFLGDDNTRSDVKRYQIAPDTIIPAGGYLVFTRDEHFGFGLDRDGEEVLLTGGNAEGELLGYSESYRFNGVEDGTTLGLHVTSTGESVFTALVQPTPGEANSLPRVGPVIINEIMYRPAFSQDEFIELYNTSDQDIDLGQTEDGNDLSWTLARTGGVIAGFTEGDIIPAHGYLLVVPGDPQLFRTTYSVSDDVTIVGPWLLDPESPLSNASENIELYRRYPDVNFVKIDQVAYSDDAPWPEEADIGGGSLERIYVDQYANDPANWGVTTTLGGSPGRRNTIAERIAGDFDGDTWVNATDIDILTTMIDRGTTGPVFDLTSDGTVDSSDVDYLVNDLLGTTYGDSDLNGQVELLDLARLSRNFGRTSEVGWASGDTNADGSVDRRDIVRTLSGMSGPATSVASSAPAAPAALVSAVDQAIEQSNAELSQTPLSARRATRPLRLSSTQRGTTTGEGVKLPTRQMLRSHRSLSVAGRLQTAARDVRLIDAALRDSLEFVSSHRSRRLV